MRHFCLWRFLIMDWCISKPDADHLLWFPVWLRFKNAYKTFQAQSIRSWLNPGCSAGIHSHHWLDAEPVPDIRAVHLYVHRGLNSSKHWPAVFNHQNRSSPCPATAPSRLLVRNVGTAAVVAGLEKGRVWPYRHEPRFLMPMEEYK